jgi:glycosyltransferase involved in cell wall biosynthesis
MGRRAVRILSVSPYNFVAGGSDRYFVEVNRALEADGHRVVRFCVQHPRNEPADTSGYFTRAIDSSGRHPFDSLRFIYSRDAAARLEALLDRHPVDVAHLHIYYGNFTGSILRVLRRRGVPIVQTVHDYKQICPVYSLNSHGEICERCAGHSFWRAAVRRCNRGSLARSALSTVETYVTDALGARDGIDRFIAVCRFQADKLVAYGVPGARTFVLHNFIDASRIAVDAVPSQRRRITYFGRIERSKGVFDLIDAFHHVPAERRAGIELVIAGTGAAVAELEERLARDRDPAVRYAGFVTGAALDELIRTSVCTVLVPRVYENCPMSVLESLALGTPVVGGAIGGIPELLTHEEDGLVVQVRDPIALGAAFERLLAEPATAEAMGRRGAAKVAADFSAPDHLRVLVSHFEAVISARSGSVAR